MFVPVSRMGREELFLTQTVFLLIFKGRVSSGKVKKTYFCTSVDGVKSRVQYLQPTVKHTPDCH